MYDILTPGIPVTMILPPSKEPDMKETSLEELKANFTSNHVETATLTPPLTRCAQGEVRQARGRGGGVFPSYHP